MKVTLHRLARSELIAAAQYLESEARLGAEFLDAFEAWARQIRQFPRSGPVIGGDIRKGVLQRFNYVIAYVSFLPQSSIIIWPCPFPILSRAKAQSHSGFFPEFTELQEFFGSCSE